jgi:hypothetical protein
VKAILLEDSVNRAGRMNSLAVVSIAVRKNSLPDGGIATRKNSLPDSGIVMRMSTTTMFLRTAASPAI